MTEQQEKAELAEREETLLLLMKEMSKLEPHLYQEVDGAAEGQDGEEAKERPWYETEFKAIPKENTSALNLKW